jgi:hypothetical protein
MSADPALQVAIIVRISGRSNFRDNLSSESFADLKHHLDPFIKKMQRRAG